MALQEYLNARPLALVAVLVATSDARGVFYRLIKVQFFGIISEKS